MPRSNHCARKLRTCGRFRSLKAKLECLFSPHGHCLADLGGNTREPSTSTTLHKRHQLPVVIWTIWFQRLLAELRRIPSKITIGDGVSPRPIAAFLPPNRPSSNTWPRRVSHQKPHAIHVQCAGVISKHAHSRRSLGGETIRDLNYDRRFVTFLFSGFSGSSP
jgi:hypothetical protein